MITKPILAAKNPNLEDIKYPVIATPKFDGIRCLIIGGRALTRTLKPIHNDYIRSFLEAHCPDGFDGEIIVPGSFNDVQSSVMTKDGKPSFKYVVFDFVQGSLEKEYINRLQDLDNIMTCNNSSNIEMASVSFIKSKDSLNEIIVKHQEQGYEGTMIRTPDSPYKCGRATLKEGYLTAIKPFEDGEAEVIGFVEQMQNNNEVTTDLLGRSERSSHKANKVPKGTLGAFVVRKPDGVEFELGTGKGLTKALRQEIWDNKDAYLGKYVHYRFQAYGSKDAPRIPIWYGFRDKLDLDKT